MNEEEVKAHTSCISEEQQWHGKFWVSRHSNEQKGHKDHKNCKKGSNKFNNFNKKKVEPKKEEPKKEEEETQEWNGWKKTLKTIVKSQKSISKKKLRKQCRKLYKASGKPELSKSEFKAKFQQKLANIKKLSLEGKTVVYASA